MLMAASIAATVEKAGVSITSLEFCKNCADIVPRTENTKNKHTGFYERMAERSLGCIWAGLLGVPMSAELAPEDGSMMQLGKKPLHRCSSHPEKRRLPQAKS